MFISLTDKNFNLISIKLADCISENEALGFLLSIDYEDFLCVCLCSNDGSIMYRIRVDSE